MARTPEMEKTLNDVSKELFGRNRDGAICVTCGSDKIKKEDFRDPLSWKEFNISKMCQKCQDEVFGGDK